MYHAVIDICLCVFPPSQVLSGPWRTGTADCRVRNVALRLTL